MSTEYLLLNPVRRGMAVYITPDLGSSSPRGAIKVRTRVARWFRGNEKAVGETPEKRIEVYGPGDVVGFDPGIVTRTDPRHSLSVMDYEPNYFPFIEFGEPDFAWRFSPEPASGSEKTVPPWITLIVLADTEFTEGDRSDDQTPWITVHPANFTQDDIEEGGRYLPLPNLEYAVKWAHVQIVTSRNSNLFNHDSLLITNRSKVAKSLREERGRSTCRLLCPRRLQPQTRYTAFVVPTYAAGVAAGLQLPLQNGTAAQKAWNVASSLSIRLPYYFKWTFGTGLRGDFEYAMRQLKPHVHDQIGKRELDGSSPGYMLPPVNRPGAPEEEKHIIGAEGALRSRKFEEQAADEDFEARLAQLLNQETRISPSMKQFNDVYVAFDEWGHSVRVRWRTATKVACELSILERATQTEASQNHFVRIDLPLVPESEYDVTIQIIGNNASLVSFSIKVPKGPVVLPPIYGRWHAGARWLTAAKHGDRFWLESLNLDPRFRVAAGIGATFVAKHQEALMTSAWDQLGDIISANDLIRRAQAGHAISSAYYDRFRMMTNSAGPAALFATAPLHTRVRLNKCEKYKDLVDQNKAELTPFIHFKTRTNIPSALFDRAYHRISAARGALRKRQKGGRKELLAKFLERFEPSHSDFLSPSNVTRPDPDFSAEAIETQLGIPILVNASVSVLGQIDDELGEQPEPTEETPPTASIEEIADALMCAIDPTLTFCDQIKNRIDISGLPDSDNRSCLDRIMAYPKFPQPMYAALAEMSQGYIAPGLEQIPQNTVGLLQTNRKFVEAFFVGFNHAFGAELLWRGYPTDQRGSYARQFWDPADFLIPNLSNDEDTAAEQRLRWEERLKDIRPMHDWKAGLGEHAVPLEANEEALEEKMVLVIRGDLLKKYPHTRIYAVKAVEKNGETVPDLLEFEGSGEVTTPVFTGELAPDITFLGFPIDESTARGGSVQSDLGYFFVFEGRPMETRLGLDEPPAEVDSGGSEDSGGSDDVCAPKEDDDLSWANVRTRASYIDPRRGMHPSTVESWEGAPPSLIARKTFQKAFRMSIHANRLLPMPSE